MRIFIVLAGVALGANVASAYQLNGYAVSNHRSCGANNLPGTTEEVERLFASSHFPQDATKNFFWKDSRVHAGEWRAAGDFKASSETANGYDGVDSSLISYIASHGATSGGRYTALMGGAGGECYIRNNEMGAGDKMARYLVLSTCQGLKIGTGDNPSAPGENPTQTWSKGNEGLNCIFGYSNNMVDASEYGDYFMSNLATTDKTLVEAFFDASHRVSYSNVPAALCFANDNEAAKGYLDTAKRFTEEHQGKGGSAFTYARSVRVGNAFVLPSDKVVPRRLGISRRHLNTERFARALVGKGYEAQLSGASLTVFRSNLGTLTQDQKSGVLSWRKEKLAAAQAMTLSDAEAVKIAREFLGEKALLEATMAEWVPSYVIERGTGTAEGSVVTEKTVVFHQSIHGLTPLAAAGSLEAQIDADGDVVGLTLSALEPVLPRIVEWLDTNRTAALDSLKKTVLNRFEQRNPKAQVRLVETRVGYDAGDYAAVNEAASVVAEFLVEVEEGGFARRYAQKVPL